MSSFKRRWSVVMVAFLLIGTGEGKSRPRRDEPEPQQSEEETPSTHHARKGDRLTKHHSKADPNERDSRVKHVDNTPPAEDDMKTSDEAKHGNEAKHMRKISTAKHVSRAESVPKEEHTSTKRHEHIDKPLQTAVKPPENSKLHNARDKFTGDNAENAPRAENNMKTTTEAGHESEAKPMKEIAAAKHVSTAESDSKDGYISTAEHREEIPAAHRHKHIDKPLQAAVGAPENPKEDNAQDYYTAPEVGVASVPKHQEFPLVQNTAGNSIAPNLKDILTAPNLLKILLALNGQNLFVAPNVKVTQNEPKALEIPPVQQAQDSFAVPNAKEIPKAQNLLEALSALYAQGRFANPNPQGILPALLGQDHSSSAPELKIPMAPNTAGLLSLQKAQDPSVAAQVSMVARKLWEEGREVARRLVKEIKGRQTYLALKNMAESAFDYVAPPNDRSHSEISEDMSTLKILSSELEKLLGTLSAKYHFTEDGV